MLTFAQLAKQYIDKWDKYILDNNIPEDDERRGCYGWQFEYDFLDSPEMVLALYIHRDGTDAPLLLEEELDGWTEDGLRDMAVRAIELFHEIAKRDTLDQSLFFRSMD